MLGAARNGRGRRRRTADFDAGALYQALDAQRIALGLSWTGVAREIWNQSRVLNARRHDHPLSPSTLTGMRARRATSCQHALAMLRWLRRVPEEFVAGCAVGARHALPEAGPDRRLRWSLPNLYVALDVRRAERGMTWLALAGEIGCSANQLTGIRTAKYAIDMRLAMRIVAWLDRPAADFVYASEW